MRSSDVVAGICFVLRSILLKSHRSEMEAVKAFTFEVMNAHRMFKHFVLTFKDPGKIHIITPNFGTYLLNETTAIISFTD